MVTFFMGTAHLLKLLSLFMGISVLEQVRSWSINVPKTISAVEGSCVVVPCQTQPHSRVTWYMYHPIKYIVVYDGLHPHKIVPQFRGRTSVLGKAAEGNCTLIINDVKTTDNKLKIYVWINPDASTTQNLDDQTVTIFVEKKAPIISIQRPIMDGTIFQVNCNMSYSCPFTPPSLYWDKSPFLETSTSMAFSEKIPGQWVYTETLHGRATYKIHNSKVICLAKFKGYFEESQTTINILYKPVNVTLKLENKPVIEGGSIIMECAADCNPQTHTYSWFKREMGQHTQINSTRRKTFNNITRDTSISCIALNDVGAGQSAWLDLDVQYAPVILPESSCTLTGKVLKCVCQAEAFPNASIHWIIDGNDTLPSSFSFFFTYTKKFASGTMSGQVQRQPNISCTATNYLGSPTKELSVDNITSYLSRWLIPLMLLGLLFGCAMFIYRKKHRNGWPPGFVCNMTILLRPQRSSDNIQPEQICNSRQRSRNVGAQSIPSRPESNPEVDSLCCVYDNDFVVEMQATRAQYQNRTRVDLREGEIQPLAKNVNYNMATYLNC